MFHTHADELMGSKKVDFPTSLLEAMTQIFDSRLHALSKTTMFLRVWKETDES